MKLTYIVTINPVNNIHYLEILINSLNIQTSKDFDVVFYNQTKKHEKDIIGSLNNECKFDYVFFNIDEESFLGNYPIWDLYGFHQFLLDNEILRDYFMSLHMEEFMEPDYTANILATLKSNKFDILFGNLYRTNYSYYDILDLASINQPDKFNRYLKDKGIDKSSKWGLPSKPFFLCRNPKIIHRRFKILSEMKWKKKFLPNEVGFTKMSNYWLEDVFAMSTEFANEYGWYKLEENLYFEDIHINYAVGDKLKNVLEFPVYFNKSKIYHLKHKKFYYQIEDNIFATKMLQYETDNQILLALKNAIVLYRKKNLLGKQALRLSRNNKEKNGTADLNYEFHLKRINDSKGFKD